MSTMESIALKEKLEHLFSENREQIMKHDPPSLGKVREEAIAEFSRTGFPHTKMEDWRNTDLTKTLERKYSTLFKPGHGEMSIDQVFQCNIHDLETDQISLLNGWFVDTKKPLWVHENGVIAGSLEIAMKT